MVQTLNLCAQQVSKPCLSFRNKRVKTHQFRRIWSRVSSASTRSVYIASDRRRSNLDSDAATYVPDQDSNVQPRQDRRYDDK